MIYLVYGNDNTQKNKEIKSLAEEASIVRVEASQMTTNALSLFALQSQLFGLTPLVVIESVFTNTEGVFSEEILTKLKESSNLFVFLEDACTQVQIKKYKKYLEDTILCEKKEKPKSATNAFIIADMYGRRDKIGAWTAYMDLIEKGEAPEAISGMLFWKIKTLILSHSVAPYSKKELSQSSSKLVDIYHKAHSGDIDMKIALEQFILSTI
jgi:hypothetical protein